MLLVERGDALEELVVEEDGVAVGGELGRDLGTNLQQRRVGVGARDRKKCAGRTLQQLAALFHGDDRVVERRRRGVIGDCLDFLQLLRHPGLNGRLEVGVFDLVPGNCLKR